MAAASALPVTQDNRTELFTIDDYCRIERWYKDVKDITFPTKILKLTFEEAHALKKARELTKTRLQFEEWQRQSPETAPPSLAQLIEQTKADMPTSLLQKVEKRLHKALADFAQTGAFVKLSTRSPKDAALTSEKMKQLLLADLRPLADQTDLTVQQWCILAVQAFIRASCRALQTNTGAEAMELFYRSQRTYEDVSLLELYQGKQNFLMKLIVRQWDPSVEPIHEFRAFVVNNRLTACTQYYQLCYVEAIAKNYEEVKKLIVEYFEKEVKEKVRVPTYTVDFAVSADLKSLKVIELNHPPPTAGTSLFDWEKESDRAIINHGPFELRILHHPHPNPLSQLEQKLAPLMIMEAPQHLRADLQKLLPPPVEVKPAQASASTQLEGTEQEAGGWYSYCSLL